VHFWAEWCAPCKQMDAVMRTLASEHAHAGFFRVDAEALPDLTEKYDVSAVPFFVVLKVREARRGSVVVRDTHTHTRCVAAAGGAPQVGQPGWACVHTRPPALHSPCKQLDVRVNHMLKTIDARDKQRVLSRVVCYPSHPLKRHNTRLPHAQGNQVVDTVDGANAPELVTKVGSHAKTAAGAAARVAPAVKPPSVTQRIQTLLQSAPVLLFMKGDRDAPRCGFSSKVSPHPPTRERVSRRCLHGTLGVSCFDQPRVVTTSCRSEDSPIACSGVSHDAMWRVEREERGARIPRGQPRRHSPSFRSHLATLSSLLISMGHLAQVVAALKETGVAFDTFDILGDEAIRQGLKEYSNWPTYPQLYVKGELLGGCDIIMEMAAEGELKQTLEQSLGVESKEALHARIKALVEGSPVMLFMKGSPSEPKCGFSRKVPRPARITPSGACPRGELGGRCSRSSLDSYHLPRRRSSRRAPFAGERGVDGDGRGVRHVRHPGGRGGSAGAEGVLQLAHVSAAVRQGRVARRVRHHHGDGGGGGASRDPGGCHSVALRM
jgi:Grx4 family monothiol glutaredoxin